MSASAKAVIKPRLIRCANVFLSDFRAIAIMAFCAICIGFAGNRFRANPLPMVYEPAPEPTLLDLPELQDLVEHRVAGLILDARPSEFYAMGHIPGAISLPRDNFQAEYRRQHSRLEQDKSQIIAVYCDDSGCDDGKTVAKILGRMAYPRVFLFKGGWEEWTAAHLMEEKAP